MKKWELFKNPMQLSIRAETTWMTCLVPTRNCGCCFAWIEELNSLWCFYFTFCRRLWLLGVCCIQAWLHGKIWKSFCGRLLWRTKHSLMLCTWRFGRWCMTSEWRHLMLAFRGCLSVLNPQTQRILLQLVMSWRGTHKAAVTVLQMDNSRIVSRGKLTSQASDFGGLEVFGGASVGHTDPFEIHAALHHVFQKPRETVDLQNI